MAATHCYLLCRTTFITITITEIKLEVAFVTVMIAVVGNPFIVSRFRVQNEGIVLEICSYGKMV